MSGLKHDLKTGDLTPDSLGTVTNVFVPGSVVKAATISSGWENGVLSGNQTLTDQPIVFQGSAPIYSWYKLAYGSFPITAVEALEYSSNAYMVQTALGIMGQTYQQICLLEPAIWKQLWENFARHLRNMVLEPQQALTFQMSQPVLYQKSIILLITLPMHLVSLITTPQCNWPSTLELLPTTVFGLHLTLSREFMETTNKVA